MKNFYGIISASKRGCIKILPNIEVDGKFIGIIKPGSKVRLPETVKFKIIKGKKEYDVIVVYECESLEFYSQELISILNHYTDMSDKCFKIKLSDAAREYFSIYNLDHYRIINRKEFDFCTNNQLGINPPTRFVISDRDIGPVFTVKTTAWIMVSEDIMKAIKNAKQTNIDFKEAYGYTPEEAVEWAQKNPNFADDFVDEQWFKNYFSK